MNRLITAAAIAASSCAVAVPAVLGLSSSPDFSQRIPVPVPSSAQLVHYDGDGDLVDR